MTKSGNNRKNRIEMNKKDRNIEIYERKENWRKTSKNKEKKKDNDNEQEGKTDSKLHESYQEWQ